MNRVLSILKVVGISFSNYEFFPSFEGSVKTVVFDFRFAIWEGSVTLSYGRR
jgi:hypothetical protein